jgi:hypothetical protein
VICVESRWARQRECLKGAIISGQSSAALLAPRARRDRTTKGTIFNRSSSERHWGVDHAAADRLVGPAGRDEVHAGQRPKYFRSNR